MPGLSTTEAQQKLKQIGVNKLPDTQTISLVDVFFRQFKSPFIYVLLAAAIVSWFLGHSVNSFFIMLVLLLNAAIGTIQEYSAAKAAEALKNMVPYYASVYRDGNFSRIPAEQIVPGDWVQLVSGDKIPADIKLASANSVIVDESLLTGESLPQAKHPQVSGSDQHSTLITDQQDMLFAGTIMTHGRAEGEVQLTGANTEIGKIAKDVTGSESIKPPLLVRMERFTLRITYAVAVLIGILFLITLLRGDDLSNAFLLGVALAVSAIPEGLPAAITIALAIGMRRMAKKGVIVRKLLAVEALGSCTYIASDKTGTLTVNEMTVRKLALADATELDVSGEGQDLHGEILDQQILTDQQQANLKKLALAGILANEASLEIKQDEIQASGDHVDLAFLVLGHKLGMQHWQTQKADKELASIPYESENAYSASICRTDDGAELFVKGSLEKVLAMCSQSANGTALDKRVLTEQMQRLATQGYRVMALACRSVPEKPVYQPQDFLNNLCFLGMVGMQDPLRPEVEQAVSQCHNSQIKVAMVTGDHPNTARAIADELGFEPGSVPFLTGDDINQLQNQGGKTLAKSITNQHVFARVEPRQKKLLVDTLAQQGEFVAVTGDGVNDAPALHAAHVGVAMGKRGTDVARESSDLIITDDNFASIVEGVKQGRVVYNNIRKVIFLLISTGAAEITLFILSILAGLPLPLMPIQLLWLNLVTNGLQDVALAFEPEEGNELRQPPRKPKEPIFNRLMLERVLTNAVVMGCLAFMVFYLQLAAGMPEESARNITLLQMVLFENIHVFNSRSEQQSIFKQSFMGNPFLLFGMLAAQGIHILAIYTPGLNSVLQLEPVSLQQWLQLLLIASSLILVSEGQKWWWAKRHSARLHL